MKMQRMITLFAVLMLFLLAGLPAAAQTAVPTPSPTPHTVPGCDTPQINVVVTIGMIGDVAANIGGSCVEVVTLMGPGVDPHLYTATERDVERLFEADMVFYGGLNLEARLTDVFEQVGIGLGIPVIAVSEAIPTELILIEPGTDSTDPHVWMDAALWAYAADAIRDGLIARLPANEAYFTANALAYADALADLHAYAIEQIATIPEPQRVLVTAHDAFQYFGRAYEIEVYAPQGITTQAEVGVQDIRETIDLLVERNIPAIFVETSISPDVIEAIVAGAEARGHVIGIGGELFSDAMGADGTPEGTYIGMIRHNVDIVVAGLTSEAQGE